MRISKLQKLKQDRAQAYKDLNKAKQAYKDERLRIDRLIATYPNPKDDIIQFLVKKSKLSSDTIHTITAVELYERYCNASKYWPDLKPRIFRRLMNEIGFKVITTRYKDGRIVKAYHKNNTFS